MLATPIAKTGDRATPVIQAMRIQTLADPAVVLAVDRNAP
jgi:hypothetical protein